MLDLVICDSSGLTHMRGMRGTEFMGYCLHKTTFSTSGEGVSCLVFVTIKKYRTQARKGEKKSLQQN